VHEQHAVHVAVRRDEHRLSPVSANDALPGGDGPAADVGERLALGKRHGPRIAFPPAGERRVVARQLPARAALPAAVRHLVERRLFQGGHAAAGEHERRGAARAPQRRAVRRIEPHVA
jgi:hypothetical protein